MTSGLWWLTSAANLPATGTNITAALTGDTITISWPPSNVGWLLQTNTVGLSSSAPWGDVPGSETRTQMNFPATTPTNPKH